MILTDPRLLTQFTDFGILIPIRPSKIVKVLEHLETLPSLKGKTWCQRHISEVVDRSQLELAHSPSYLSRLYGPELEAAILDAYELVDADGKAHRYAPETAQKPLSLFFHDIVLLQAAGTLQTCRMALETGWAFFTGGGMHHAHRDRGSGFCLVNDMVCSARTLQGEGLIKTVWIIDVDAHKGDGTASVCQGDDSILTLSIHMGSGWPLDAQTTQERGDDNPSLVLSDVDVCQFPSEDRLYLSRLETALNQLSVLSQKRWGKDADLAIVVDGSDPYEADELPSSATLQLTLEEMLSRDLMVDEFLTKRKIPAAWLNAGGYGESVWKVYAQFLERVLPEKLDRS